MTENQNIPELAPCSELDTDNTKSSKKGFHPKRFLKNLQQKFYKSQYMYLSFCFLVPIIIMYIAYLVKGIYPFGTSSPLVLDLNAQYVYFFEALRRFIYGDASILYSFARSLGGEFMGIYAYYAASPLTYIVALFPIERMQEAVLCILLLKAGFCGLTFGFYLHKKTKNPHRLAIFTFSVMYALSAYAVVQQSNTMWIDAMIWLPLFVYGLENLICKRKYKLYVISLSVILICNYYIGYMVCIFAVLYFFYYYFSKSKQEINPHGEKLHFIRTGSRFAAFSILAAMISAFMLIAAYYSLGFGKTEFSNPDWSLKASFNVLDFLAKFLPGAYDTVEPSGLPFIYCGLLTVILLPVYFTAKNISTREKIASLALVAAFVISLFVSPIDIIWHGFSVPNWLNARYSFIFCFILLVLAYKGFGNLKQTSERFLLGIGAFIVLFVAVAEKQTFESFIQSDEKLLTFACIWFSIFFVIAIIVLLCLKLRIKNKKTSKSISAVLTALICLELVCNAATCMLQFHKDVVFSTYKSYSDFLGNLRPVVEQVNEYDNGFYRMEKVHHRTRNDNMALGLRGFSSSTSTLNSEAIEFVNQMGYVGRSHLTSYRGGTPFSDSVLGVKYVIDYSSSTSFSNFYDEVPNIDSEKYKVMHNPYALSLAYGVSTDVQLLDLSEQECFFDTYNKMATAMLGESTSTEMFKPVSYSGIDSKDCDVTENTSNIKCKTGDESGTIYFEYVAPYSGNYYFYAPTSKTEEMTLSVNGTSKGKVMGRDTDNITNIGYFEEGSIIEIDLLISAKKELSFYSNYDFLWYIDNDVYTSCMVRIANAPQFNINADSTDDNIFGTVSTSKENQMMMTTIPYDEGWNVYVDGEKVETYKTLDALMAFDIEDSGTHTLEMKYMPSCYKVGIAISIVGILTFVALCTVEFIIKKTRFKNKFKTYEPEFWLLEDFEEAPVPCISPCPDEQGQLQEEAKAEENSGQNEAQEEKATTEHENDQPQE